MRSWWRKVSPGIYANLIYVLMRVLGATYRMKIVGDVGSEHSGRGRILCGWHGRSFLVPLAFRNRGYYVLVSHSRDGEIASRVWKKFGFNVLRGSTGTSKGGARAAVQCAKALQEGATLVFSPDGPKGPSHVVQQGLVWLARRGDAIVIPSTAYAVPSKLMRSWDQYLLPLPFARAKVVIGTPVTPDAVMTDEQEEQFRQHIEQEMTAIEEATEREMTGH